MYLQQQSPPRIRHSRFAFVSSSFCRGHSASSARALSHQHGRRWRTPVQVLCRRCGTKARLSLAIHINDMHERENSRHRVASPIQVRNLVPCSRLDANSRVKWPTPHQLSGHSDGRGQRCLASHVSRAPVASNNLVSPPHTPRRTWDYSSACTRPVCTIVNYPARNRMKRKREGRSREERMVRLCEGAAEEEVKENGDYAKIHGGPLVAINASHQNSGSPKAIQSG